MAILCPHPDNPVGLDKAIILGDQQHHDRSPTPDFGREHDSDGDAEWIKLNKCGSCLCGATSSSYKIIPKPSSRVDYTLNIIGMNQVEC
jgi:hypothetical protein